MSFSVSCIKNWILEDPLLDYLNLYGNPEEKDSFAFPECNFTNYIMNKGIEYEKRVYDHIDKHKDMYSMKIIDRKHFYKQTQDAFKQQIDIICQPFLKDYHYRIFNKYQIYGFPDILVKKSAFLHLFNTLHDDHSIDFSKNLYSTWLDTIGDDSYIVIDVKYSTFTHQDSQMISKRPYDTFVESQVMLYQHLINSQKIQNVKFACILPKQKIQENKKLHVLWVDMNKQTQNYKQCEKALLWNSYLHTPHFTEYSLNELITGPDQTQLMPNLNNNMDYPWSSYKNKLARQYGEISLFSGVGSVLRRSFKGELNNIKLPCYTQLLIDSFEQDFLLPCEKIDYRNRLYIDIETCYMFEESREQIIMICCGYIKDTKWFVRYFTEVQDWIRFMNGFREYTIVHFSSAENKILQQLSYVPLTDDLYKKVKEFYKTNRLRIKGLTGFSIKDIMRQLAVYNYVEENPYDGCKIKSGIEVLTIYNRIFEKERIDENIIEEVEKYNEADVKSLYLLDRFLSSPVIKN
jgi:hypothetical protein